MLKCSPTVEPTRKLYRKVDRALFKIAYLGKV
jgi:hypothetical protein